MIFAKANLSQPFAQRVSATALTMACLLFGQGMNAQGGSTPRWTFKPDAGHRVIPGTNCAPMVVSSTEYYLNYVTVRTQWMAKSTDGLKFTNPTRYRDIRYNPHVIEMPKRDANGNRIWRKYRHDMNTGYFYSESSTDRVNFTKDPGVRYTPHPSDKGRVGVHCEFTDNKGGVVLLYIGDMQQGGVNNVRRAYSTDNGWTFKWDRGNVFDDARYGGGGWSYVDPRQCKLPDGRIAIFVMQQGARPPHPPHRKVGTIHCFLSDDGDTFTKEPYLSLRPEDFTEFPVYSLNDPWVVLLPDGRYRMYVTGTVPDPSSPGNYTEAIISAVTESNFGSGCKGSSGQRPVIGQLGEPSIGSASYKVSLSDGPARGVVALCLGISSTRWGSLTLPLDLSSLGMTGCELLVSPELSLSSSATSGRATVSVPIPDNSKLRRASAYAQWFCLDPGANRTGITASDGLRIDIY